MKKSDAEVGQRLITEYAEYGSKKLHEGEADAESLRRLAQELLEELKRWHNSGS